MATTQSHVRRLTVYRALGHVDEVPPEPDPLERDPPFRAAVADRVSIRSIMSRDVLCVGPDLDIATVIHLVIDRHIGCLPVVDERRHPIGIITKFDLVEQLDAAMQFTQRGGALPSDLTAQTAEDVMMPLANALDEHATIAHAAAMMIGQDTHHALVVSQDLVLVGVVSTKDIVRWVSEHDTLSVRRDAQCGPPVWRPLEG